MIQVHDSNPASVRRFLSDGMIYAVSSAVSQLSPLLLVPIYVRVLTQAEVGFVALLTALLALAIPLGVLGFDSAAARMYWTLELPAEQKRLLATWFWTQAATSGTLCVVVVVGSGAVAALLGPPAFAYAVMAAAGVLPLRVVAVFLNNWFRTQRKPLSALAFNTVLSVATVVATLGLLLVEERGVAGIFEAQVLALAATTLLWSPTLVRLAGRPSVDRPLLARMLRYSLPLVPAALLAWLYSYADRWMMGTWVGLADAGIYQIGVYASMAVGLPVLAFGQAWGPFAFQIERRPDAVEVLGRIVRLVTIGTTLLAFLLTIWGEEALILVAGEGYGQAWPSTALLAFGQVTVAFTMMGALQCNLGNNNRPYLAALAVSAAASLGLNAVLLPRVGFIGAAAAFLVSHTLAAALLFVWSRRVYDLHYPLRPMGLAVGLFATLAVAAGVAAAVGMDGVWLKVALTAVGLAVASSLLWAMHTSAAGPLSTGLP